MSEFLDSMRQDFDARLNAHEGMLAYLGLHLTDQDASLVISSGLNNSQSIESVW